MSVNPTRTLCLGDALVDMVGERPGRELIEIDRFSPHFGGAAANVALVAAKAGAQIALAGGAGDDVWGRWLVQRLRDARVDVSLFELQAGTQTPLAFVTVDAEAEPEYHMHGEMAGSLGPGDRGPARGGGRGFGGAVHLHQHVGRARGARPSRCAPGS